MKSTVFVTLLLFIIVTLVECNNLRVARELRERKSYGEPVFFFKLKIFNSLEFLKITSQTHIPILAKFKTFKIA